MATGYQLSDQGLFITGIADDGQEQTMDNGLFFEAQAGGAAPATYSGYSFVGLPVAIAGITAGLLWLL